MTAQPPNTASAIRKTRPISPMEAMRRGRSSDHCGLVQKIASLATSGRKASANCQLLEGIFKLIYKDGPDESPISRQDRSEAAN
jgi:hypothetical protein